MIRKLHCLGLVLVPAVCLTLVLTSSAQNPKGEEDVKDDPAANAVQQVTTAYQLVEFGRKNKAPEALITAAGMLRQVPEPKPLKAEVETERDPSAPKDTGEAPEKIKPLEDQAEDLFTEALVMASKDTRDAVEKLIKAVKARPEPKPEPGTKGALGGPKVINRVLAAKATDNWKITFVGGQPAVVGFRASLVCRISWHGPAGGMIGKDDCMVGRAGWMPVKTATHTLRVHNLSPRPVSYSLFTN